MAPNVHLERARNRGVNPIVYWLVRGVLQPFFHLYFRMSRIGREHIPAEGPVILAANHRSFLDPFVIGCMVRRPCYFVAKKELFENRFIAWFLNSLGAFPIDRGNTDTDAMSTAREILERGDVVVIFPEGTRIRPGVLAKPKRGVGRLALETGAPVVPVAVIGTEDIRKGVRVRPHKVRIRAGRALHFPTVENPSPQLAGAVTDRLWPMVALQWEWLGGLAPIRTVAVVGAGARSTGLAGALRSAGVTVELGRASDLDLQTPDLVILDVPARALPAVLAAHGQRIGERAAVLTLPTGLVAPMATLPAEFVGERVRCRGVATLAGPIAGGLGAHTSLVVAAPDKQLVAQIADLLQRAGFDTQRSTDITGAQLAAAAKSAAVVAAATAQPAGANAAGAAAGKVYAEIDVLGQRLGAQPETFAGLAGVGDLVASVVAGSIDTDGADALPLLAYAMREHRITAPVTAGLAEVVEGRADAEAWAAGVTAPFGRRAAA